jgi:hypothetical protein
MAISVELALGLRGQYVLNPPFFLVLNLAIFGGVSFAIAYLSAKGYLFTGSLTLLLITISFIFFAIMGFGTKVFSYFSLLF